MSNKILVVIVSYNRLEKLKTLFCCDSQFNKYKIKYILGMVKHFFTDHMYYLSQMDGFMDYRKGVFGI